MSNISYITNIQIEDLKNREKWTTNRSSQAGSLDPRRRKSPRNTSAIFDPERALVVFGSKKNLLFGINMYIQIYTNAKYVHGYISSISHK